MKKLISILSVILLVVAFSIPCASGDGPPTHAGGAFPHTTPPGWAQPQPGPQAQSGESDSNASIESSSVETLDSAQEPQQKKKAYRQRKELSFKYGGDKN